MAQLDQNIQQHVAVFAAQYADHDFVSIFNHVEIVDGLSDLTAQTLVELVAFMGDLFYLFQAGERVGAWG